MGIENSATRVIVNADDFGYSFGVNKGIREAIDHGVVTSTSVMVNRIAAGEARELAERDDISLGIHLDMTEEGLKRWLGMITIGLWSVNRVQEELDRQIKEFERITGRLPDHVDSHHHIHRVLPNWKPVVRRFSKQNNIPVRSFNARFVRSFFGRSLTKSDDFQKVGVPNLISIIKTLPPGTHEIMTHPGYVDSHLREIGSYLDQREEEVKTLTSPEVKNFIAANPSIKLISWKDVKFSRAE